MTAKVIHNPYSGRWRSQERRPEAEAALLAAGIDYEWVVTEGPGHGIRLAAQAVREGFSPIISAGGDGSVSEVVNGMLQGEAESGNLPPLGVIPLGTANDIAVNLKLPLELNAAAQVIARGQRRRMDLGELRWGPKHTLRYFDNNSASGLEPTVTLIQQRITWLKGTLRYLAATLVAIIQNPSWTAELEWEGSRYSGPVTLVTVGNHPVTGGMFYMTPHANGFDGKLTFVYGHMATRRQILRLLPRTMKPGAGSYVDHPDIHEVHTPWLKVRYDQPTPLHADGEIQSEAVTEIEYRVLPGRIEVLV